VALLAGPTVSVGGDPT